jgi:hypothetical protein
MVREVIKESLLARRASKRRQPGGGGICLLGNLLAKECKELGKTGCNR